MTTEEFATAKEPAVPGESRVSTASAASTTSTASKEPAKSASSFEKFEFWALAALFVLYLPALVNPYTSAFHAGVLIRFVLLFLIFLYVNFRLAPKIIAWEQPVRAVLTVLGVVATLTVIQFTFAFFAGQVGERQGPGLLQESFVQSLGIVLAYAGYVAIKQGVVYVLSKASAIEGFLIIFNRDSLLVMSLWILLAYCMMIAGVPAEIWFTWLSVIPSGVLLHGLSFKAFIPGSLRWKYPLISYFFKTALFCIAVVFIVAVPIMIVKGSEDLAFTIGSLNGVLHFVLTAPALWLIYRWQMTRREQIYELQSELGRSVANVDFLRSQINPHFLFNALNTIYGLAIQEKADRTSESIQKLGEMMRFMLNENTQERIALSRELEYLTNYISLQKLRTDSNPVLRIQVDVPAEIETTTKITPMLLIPFVENAFKHGISLREESYIKISLELKDTTLYFDVLNSTHVKNGNDPEKNSNGIGIANVRHRLQHIYRGRHEITIRETSRDFFVHLKVKLD